MSFADYGAIPTSNETVIYAVSQEPSFDIVFEGLSAALFWFLFLAHGGFGVYLVLSGQWRVLKRWPLYLMMLAYVVVTCICESVALGYTVDARASKAINSVYLVYIFFWHASNASFLVLLLALSSGYCITRGDLEGHQAKVWVIPGIVFVAGVASDFTFVYVQSTQELSTAADRYNIVQMTAWESAVWFIGSLANIMCFILAWIYIFDSTQLEIKALDDAQAELQGQRRQDEEEEEDPFDPHAMRRARDRAERDSDDEAEPHANGNGATHSNGAGPASERRALGRASQRMGLLYGMEDSSGARDPEAGENKETFADHMEYTVRKTLLSRFYFGVCGYLIVSIMVILLPAFFNTELQNVIVVLQFIVKYIFTLLLAWIFRPGKDSPYLQVGVSENDAEDRGVGALDTELAVTEFPGATTPTAANGSSSTSGIAGGSSGLGGAAPLLPISKPATEGSTGGAARSKPYLAAIRSGEPPPEDKKGPKFTLDEDE